jgi:hypothetical protein
LLPRCVRSAQALPEEKAAFARRLARLLQRENGLRAEEKKQHLPMKKPFFRLDGPSFSISIRTASECSFHWWFINF